MCSQNRASLKKVADAWFCHDERIAHSSAENHNSLSLLCSKRMISTSGLPFQKEEERSHQSKP